MDQYLARVNRNDATGTADRPALPRAQGRLPRVQRLRRGEQRHDQVEGLYQHARVLLEYNDIDAMEIEFTPLPNGGGAADEAVPSNKTDGKAIYELVEKLVRRQDGRSGAQGDPYRRGHHKHV